MLRQKKMFMGAILSNDDLLFLRIHLRIKCFIAIHHIYLQHLRMSECLFILQLCCSMILIHLCEMKQDDDFFLFFVFCVFE